MSNRIIHQCSAPKVPRQNGLAEIKNWTLVEMINAKLLIAKLLSNLWSEALLSICQVVNMIPSKRFKVSFYELRKMEKTKHWIFRSVNVSCL